MTAFRPRGVCSTKIEFEVDSEGIVHDVRFTQGCPGNSGGLARLAEGRPATELIELLKGTPCGMRDTSCPDQFAIALEAELAKRAVSN